MPSKTFRVFSALLFSLLFKSIGAQSLDFTIKEIGTPLFETFQKEEYGGHESSYRAIQGEDGMLYFGNVDGLIQYDGVTFRNYRDLDDNYRDVISVSDKIFILTKSVFGLYQPEVSGRLAFSSLMDKMPSSYTELGTFEYFYLLNGKIIIQATHDLLIFDLKSSEITHIKVDGRIGASAVIDGHLLIFVNEDGLFSINEGKLMALGGFAPLKTLSVSRIASYQSGKFLVATTDGQIFVAGNDDLSPWRHEVESFLKGKDIIAFEQILDGYYVLATKFHGLVVLDLRGRLVQKLDKTTGFPDNEIRSFFMESEGNLWVVQRGVYTKVLLNSPFTKFSELHGINAYILDMERVGDMIYLATDRGVFYKNDLTPWQKMGDFRPFQAIADLNVRTQIFVSKDKKLFAGTRDGLALITGTKMEILYSGESLMGEGVAMEHEDRVIFGSNDGHLQVFEKIRGKWQYSHQVKEFQHQVDFIEEAGDGDFWITDSGLGVIKISLNDRYDSLISLKPYGVAEGLPSVQRNRLYRHRRGLVWLTERGIYAYNQETDRFEPDPFYGNLFRDEQIIRFTELSDGSIMVYLRKEDQLQYAFLRKQGDSFVREDSPHQIISTHTGEFITSFEGNDAWIGSSGLIHFSPEKQQNPVLNAMAKIRKVTITSKEDSTLFWGQGEKIENDLSAGDNGLQFEFGATFFDRPKLTLFQSYLEGFDKDWSRWSSDEARTYTNLPHGNYIFRLRAKNLYGQISEEGIFIFSISRPWYLTIWAFLIYGLFILLIIWILLKWNSRRLLKENESLEKLIQERTSEISEQANEIRKQKEKAEKDREIIQQQKDRLQELDKVKSRFFANISHELRTPLTLINAPLESLIETGNIKDPDVLQTLATATRNGVSLLSLVEEILDLAKLEAGKLELVENPTRLHELIHEILKSYTDVLQSKSLHLQFNYQLDEKMAMMLDERKYEKIIRNLISNALKFTPPGGQISIAVNTVKVADQEMIKTSVSDTGTGIHPTDLPHVFDRYYQSEQPNMKAEGGTGIGLALVKELCELFGGSIAVESALGEGTTFSFELPLKKVEQETVVPLKVEESGPLGEALKETIKAYTAKFDIEKPVLLITEDHPEMRAFIAQTLNPYFEIKQAQNGAVALGILESENIDIVISDVMMPVMDGFELLEEIRKNKSLRDVSVIMLTARADHEDKLYALTLGIDDYLTKPFNASEFLARIKNILENRIKIIRELKGLNTSAQNTGAFDLQRFIKKYDFSEREVEVMRLMAERKNNAQIAEELFVSLNTVKFHLKNIYGKLGIKSRLEAVEHVRPLAS
jgi:signal transduction histidine kinase/DNA-binding NarL/FixJ family response regulator/ligand-binding sensor domain-containing protein